MDIEVCTCVAKALADAPCQGAEARLSTVRLIFRLGLGTPLTLLHGAPEPSSSVQDCTRQSITEEQKFTSGKAPTPGCDESGRQGGGESGGRRGRRGGETNVKTKRSLAFCGPTLTPTGDAGCDMGASNSKQATDHLQGCDRVQRGPRHSFSARCKNLAHAKDN